MTLNELAKNDQLSTRAINVCQFHKLLDSDAILNYYHRHQTFGKLRYCGRKTNAELMYFCQKNYLPSPTVVEELPIPMILDHFSELQMEIYVDYTNSQLIKLSTRAKSAMHAILGEGYSITTLQKKFLAEPKLSISNIPNVGLKTYFELSKLKGSINIFIRELYLIRNMEHLFAIKHWKYINETFFKHVRGF